MQLTNVLIAAFAVLADAQYHHPHYYYPNQQNKAAQPVGSGINGTTGLGNGYGSNSGTTGTGTGTNDNVLNSGTGTTGDNDYNATPSGSQSSGVNTGTNNNVLKAASPGSQSSGSGSTNLGSTNSGSTNSGSTNSGSTNSGSTNSGSPSTSSGNSAGGMTASFTQYGPCHRTSVACGWYSSSGYNAAISQAVYGGGPGSGATAQCGVCWKLTPDAAGANEIVVKINDLCPDDGNPLCAQPAGESLSLLLYCPSYYPRDFLER